MLLGARSVVLENKSSDPEERFQTTLSAIALVREVFLIVTLAVEAGN